MIYLFELSHGKAVKKKVINQEEIYKFKTDYDLYWNQNCKELIIFEVRKESSTYSYYPKFLDEDLMMIDNHRLLHGRTIYNVNEGKRLLQGCYIDYDSSEGKLRHLKRKFGFSDMLLI